MSYRPMNFSARLGAFRNRQIRRETRFGWKKNKPAIDEGATADFIKMILGIVGSLLLLAFIVSMIANGGLFFMLLFAVCVLLFI